MVCTAEEETWMLKDSKKANKLREQFLKMHGIEVRRARNQVFALCTDR